MRPGFRLPATPIPTLVLTVALIGVAGCSGPIGELDEDVTLDYRYQDASVPPEHHRSYRLVLDGSAPGGPARGSFVVDSYGDVIRESDVTVDGPTWSAALDDLADLELDDGSPDDCVGGTSRHLTIRSMDGDTIVDRSVAGPCGGEGGDAARALDEAVEPLLAGLDRS